MLESRNSYGWGYVGTDKEGFEWLWVYGEKYHERIRSGYVYKTEDEAMREGEKFRDAALKRNPVYWKGGGVVSAVKAEKKHFEY